MRSPSDMSTIDNTNVHKNLNFHWGLSCEGVVSRLVESWNCSRRSAGICMQLYPLVQSMMVVFTNMGCLGVGKRVCSMIRGIVAGNCRTNCSCSTHHFQVIGAGNSNALTNAFGINNLYCGSRKSNYKQAIIDPAKDWTSNLPGEFHITAAILETSVSCVLC